jgi:hypothetical protein
MEFLVWLQASAFARWVGESDSIWAYPAILTLHTIGLALVVGPNVVLDFRLLGLGREAPIGALENVFRPMWIGFAINAASGVALFVSQAEFIGIKPIFYVKLGLIALGLVTVLMIRQLVFKTRAALDAPVSAGVKVLAATSLIVWAAAIAAGRYTAYSR